MSPEPIILALHPGGGAAKAHLARQDRFLRENPCAILFRATYPNTRCKPNPVPAQTIMACVPPQRLYPLSGEQT